MNARFHAPGTHSPGELASLPGEEAQHLIRVLRLKRGDAIRVFDGRGHEFDATVEGVEKGAATVRIAAARAPGPERRVAVTLTQAILKGDKMDDVVRDAVMMGVAAIQPVVTTRSEVTLASMARGQRRERWHRVAVSSAKQCGRATVPLIHAPQAFETVIRGISQPAPGPALMFVEPAATGGTTLAECASAPTHEATVIIGPEGGWTPDEVDLGASACRLVTLRGSTLRADAMAVVALAALFTHWGEL